MDLGRARETLLLSLIPGLTALITLIITFYVGVFNGGRFCFDLNHYGEMLFEAVFVIPGFIVLYIYVISTVIRGRR